MKHKETPEGWVECKLGDIASLNLKAIRGDYPFSEIQYLDTGSITKGKIEGYQTFLLDNAPSRAKRLVQDSDIIYSTVRPNQRHYGFIKNPEDNLVVSTGFSVITANKNKANPLFLYHSLSTVHVVELLHAIAENSTSAYPSLRPIDIENLAILLPPLKEQEAIAEVLSSLDDKIDLLHRQNETLEQLAETLFRHHFIENTQDDWEERPLSYFGNIICGKTPSKKQPDYFGGHIPFIKIPDMHNKAFIIDTSDTLTREGLKSQIKKTIPPLSICISCIATVGLVSMNVYESQTNQQINSIIPNEEIYRYFLFCLLRRLKKELINMAIGGTTTLNLNTGNFSKMKVISPNKSLIENFHILVEPFFTKILTNQKQIQTLEKLRDTLLPKLISGQIRVEL